MWIQATAGEQLLDDALSIPPVTFNLRTSGGAAKRWVARVGRLERGKTLASGKPVLNPKECVIAPFIHTSTDIFLRGRFASRKKFAASDSQGNTPAQHFRTSDREEHPAPVTPSRSRLALGSSLFGGHIDTPCLAHGE
jgi:hypothetical protein